MARSKKKAAKKAAKKSRKSPVSRITAVKRLAKRPMKELTKKVSLLSEAIVLKTRNDLERKGELVGPRLPTESEKRWMASERKKTSKAQRLANLAKARAARVLKQLPFGPRYDPVEQAAMRLLAKAERK